jgi:hypothetical protein
MVLLRAVVRSMLLRYQRCFDQRCCLTAMDDSAINAAEIIDAAISAVAMNAVLRLVLLRPMVL